VRERKPDLVITDLLMPNMDGEELMRRLRADPATKDMPAIIYTATYRAREARAIADRVGVRQVLAKPSEPNVIAPRWSRPWVRSQPQGTHLHLTRPAPPSRESRRSAST
jgi:CheY-like chemotaxis protein